MVSFDTNIVLSVRRVNECERNSTMFAIDREIGIERQYGVSLIDFGHPNDTRIGERHRSVPIFLMQFAKSGDMLVDAERDPERAIFEKAEQRILCPREAREQMHRLGQHWFTHEKWRVQFFDPIGCPTVMPFRPVEKGNQRPRINDCGGHRDQNL